MKPYLFGLGALVLSAVTCSASSIVFEAAGPSAASITATRDAFRTAIGGGTVAGANGDFGGVRREINWDGVPDFRADPNFLPPDFFNVASPRGVVFSTPGTGFMVSANGGLATPVLFGFPNDFQTFSAQRLFTPISSNITDVQFFLPGTTTAATVTAFGLIFTDVEVFGSANLQFFDENDNLIFSRDALVGGNQGLTFLGGLMNGGEHIGRVRITSGTNTIVSNGVLGNPNDDVVAMDDFIYATPTASVTNVPDRSSVALLASLALLALFSIQRLTARTPVQVRR